MAVDFTKPVTTDLRATVLQIIRDNLVGQAKLYDGETLTGTPTNAIRYSSSNSRFEKWNGSSWVELTLALLKTTGGTMSGALNTLGVLPTANNASNLGSDALRYAGVYATNFYEAGTALSSKYSAAGHTHSYLPLSGGTLTGTLNGTSAAFSASLTVGGVAVSVATHTHSYLPLSGGTLTGALVTAAAGIELGHATDTTLARIAAGRASVEGRELVTLGFSASSAKVTRGTADPSGGADGDIYLQYT